MPLTREDLKVLLELDSERREDNADLWNLSREPVRRLLEAGLIDENLDITADGVDRIEQVKAALKKLKKGIPFSARKKKELDDKQKEELASASWYAGTIFRKPYVMDRSMIYIGKPVPWLKAEKMPSNLRKQLPRVIAMHKGKDYEKVVPIYYQTDGKIDGLELVWLGGENGTKVAVQAMYYDFIAEKFPSAKFFAANKLEKAVKAVIKGKGITSDHVVAFIMQFKPKGVKVPGGGKDAEGKEVQE